MKNLKVYSLAITGTTALILALGAAMFDLPKVAAQISIFALAGLFVQYQALTTIKWMDLLLVPLVVLSIFSSGLSSTCLDIAIYFYIIYRFAPSTETSGILGVALFLPLIVLSKPLGILPEAFVTAISWVLLVYLTVDWPIKKFKEEHSKSWIEWFYALVACSLFFENQLYNYFHVEFALLLLSILAILSQQIKLGALFALLTLFALSSFDVEVNILLFSVVWFSSYGAIAFFVVSPFFTKLPAGGIEQNVALHSAFALYYMVQTKLFNKETYQNGLLSMVFLFVGLLAAFETKEHWISIQTNIGSQNWFALVHILWGLIASFLVYKEIIKPIKNKWQLSDLSYKHWNNKQVASTSDEKIICFIEEKSVAVAYQPTTIIVVMVLVFVSTVGFLWLASIV